MAKIKCILSELLKQLKDIATFNKYNVESINFQNLDISEKMLAQAKKDVYNNVLDKIEYHSGEPTFDDGWSAAIWYLKKRNIQPQSTWKPSDEQIKALNLIIITGNISSVKQVQELTDLYKDLKKLGEE